MASEVKGVWFISARRFLEENGRGAVVDRVSARLPAQFRGAFTEPSASEWYPEEALAVTLRLLREEGGAARDDEFIALIEGITLVGINRFFRLLLSVASADFVLRKIPVMWDHIRRGDGRVVVETSTAGATIRYSMFPWFHDPVYPLMTLGSIRALLRVVGVHSEVRCGALTRTSMEVIVVHSKR